MPPQEQPTIADHDAQRAGHLLMLEFGSRTQFDDPSLDYRRLFSERGLGGHPPGRGGDPIAHAAGSGVLTHSRLREKTRALAGDQ
jgi:hypothetical protein